MASGSGRAGAIQPLVQVGGTGHPEPAREHVGVLLLGWETWLLRWHGSRPGRGLEGLWAPARCGLKGGRLRATRWRPLRWLLQGCGAGRGLECPGGRGGCRLEGHGSPGFSLGHEGLGGVLVYLPFLYLLILFFLLIRRFPASILFPYTTLFRSTFSLFVFFNLLSAFFKDLSIISKSTILLKYFAISPEVSDNKK